MLEVGGCDEGFETDDGVAVAAYEEFAEIPTDGVALVEAAAVVGVELVDHLTEVFVVFWGVGAALIGGLSFEVGVEGGFVVAVDVDFGHDGEGYVVGEGAEGADFVGGARFLTVELVAWEGEDFEALVVVFLIEGFEAFVLRSEATAAGDVDDEEDFALIVGEGDGVAVVGEDVVGVDLAEWGCGVVIGGGIIIVVVAGREEQRCDC